MDVQHTPSPLIVEIQGLRRELEDLLDSGHSINDPAVVAVSHKIDRLVLAYYGVGGTDADRL